jgi:TonB-linked SusC/RagA family outer membrane protein
MDQISQVPELQRQFAQGNNGEWVSGFQRSWGPNVDTLQYMTDPDYIWDAQGQIVGESDPLANGTPVNTYDQYDFFQNGFSFNNRLSVTAGNDMASYFFSVADLEQSGIVPNSGFGRTNVRLNSSAKLTKWLKMSTNMAYTNSRSTQIQTGSNTSGVMLGLVRTPPTFDNEQLYEFPDGTQRTYRHGGGYDNPYWTANKNSYDDRTDRFIGNTILNFTFTDWFSASYNLGIDTYSRQYKNIIAVNSRTAPPGTVEEGTRNFRQFNSDLLLNFHKSFGDLYASLTLGYNLFETGYKDVWGDAFGLEIPEFYQLNNSSDNQTGVGINKYRTSAVFGDIQLAYKDMIFLGATGRNDWSTTMPEDNLSAFYPSVSLGFVFTEIGALKGNSILSFGKIRGSWAKTANIATAYKTLSYYRLAHVYDGWTNAGVGFPYQGTTSFDVEYTLGNPGLKHETMQSFEVGADLRFLNNRLGVDVSYFLNNNTDLLLDVPIATSSGYREIYQNAGEMESKGIEISANVAILQGDFTWDIFGNFTKMTNTVIQLAEGVESVFLAGFTDPQVRAVADKSYGSIYGYDWYRDPDTGATLINDDPSDAERDGYPMTDASRLQWVGDINPNWTANITSTFGFKGIRLSLLIDIRNGGLMYNGTASAMNYMGTHGRTVNREVYYTDEGTIDFEKTPAENLVVFDGVYGHVDADGNPVSSGVQNVSPVVMDEDWYEGYGSNFGGGPSIFALEPTDWVRLREVTLSYTIPVQKKVIQFAEVYFIGRNLWLSTPYTGIDPETNLQGSINGQGMDYFNMPGTKSYTVGVKLSF